jgi:hypothetical protein
MSFFFFYKISELEGKIGPVSRVDIIGMGEEEEGVNIVQIPCTPACKWKNETC